MTKNEEILSKALSSQIDLSGAKVTTLLGDRTIADLEQLDERMYQTWAFNFEQDIQNIRNGLKLLEELR
jgi:hypothetical protein